MIRLLVFDWGDTIMRDYSLPGPMSQWPEVAWIPGAEAALKHLAQRYFCVIATSAGHSDVNEMKLALARVGADRYFQLFFAQKELGYKKPDVRFFTEVVRLSGFQPHESAMIGNLYDKDIVGAKKAGMTAVLFDENNNSTQYFPDADHVIGSMHQLITLFP
ncbi:MAG: HAD hydrolase-like protein [Bacteroidetes bacterium]|nr:HAD hydrolase-like protein [Bacteroidales bacterium]MBU1011196.1 HAD hydrolase-like protein [Bacteroidota bacterium]